MPQRMALTQPHQLAVAACVDAEMGVCEAACDWLCSTVDTLQYFQLTIAVLRDQL